MFGGDACGRRGVYRGRAHALLHGILCHGKSCTSVSQVLYRRTRKGSSPYNTERHCAFPNWSWKHRNTRMETQWKHWKHSGNTTLLQKCKLCISPKLANLGSSGPKMENFVRLVLVVLLTNKVTIIPLKEVESGRFYCPINV